MQWLRILQSKNAFYVLGLQPENNNIQIKIHVPVSTKTFLII